MHESHKKALLSKLIFGNKRSLFSLLWSVLLPITGSVIFTFYATGNFNSFYPESTLFIVTFFVLATLAMSLALLPTTFVAVISGYYWGFNQFVAVIISYLIASAIGYSIGKKLDHGHFTETLHQNKKLAAFSEGLNRNESIFIILGRISPVLPFALMNLFFAFMKIDFKKFFFIGMIGMLPRTTLSYWAGTQCASIYEIYKANHKIPHNELLMLLLIFSSSFGMILLFRRILKKSSLSGG